MGDTVEPRYYNDDIVLLIVKGSLKEEFSWKHPRNSLIELINGLGINNAGRGRVFVLDLTDASLDESDVTIIRDAYAYAVAGGGGLLVADPEGLFSQSQFVQHFNSVEDAVAAVEKAGIPLPVQIYLDDESAGDEVQLALEAVLDKFGIGQLAGPPPVRGSWYRQLTGWMRRAEASQGAVDLARAMDIQLVERYQAGIDVATSDAVATLITALEKTPGAVIQAGSVLLVKSDGIVIVRQLTQREMVHWQQNPGLFKDPARALNVLQQAAESPEAEWLLPSSDD